MRAAERHSQLIQVLAETKKELALDFTILQGIANNLKQLSPTYVAPWEVKPKTIEIVSIPADDANVRKYRVRNAKDAIVHAIHSLATKTDCLRFRLGDVYEELYRQGYKYAYVTLSIAGSAITRGYTEGVHTDPQGRKVKVNYNNGRNSFSVIKG